MSRYALLLPALLLSLTTAMADSTIKKCQDATGKWHYGDTAAEECARSKVVEMSSGGVTRKEIAAPLTEEELRRSAASAAEDERKRREAGDRARTDQLLLSTYGHEQDILFVRDRKLGQIESSIKATEETLKSLRAALARLEQQAAEDKDPKSLEQTQKAVLQTKAQIARHQATIESRRKEQEAIRAQAEADLKRYRELKEAKTGKPAPAATKP
jgi:hypothetical protein